MSLSLDEAKAYGHLLAAIKGTSGFDWKFRVASHIGNCNIAIRNYDETYLFLPSTSYSPYNLNLS
jgi:hypothetical protein